MALRFKLGERFQIDGGDGDQSFFSEPRHLMLVEETWFPGSLPGKDNALLFLIEGGAYSGRYVALTSKTTISIVDQMSRNRVAGVVVHLITNPTISFEENENDMISLGMAGLKRI